MPQEYGALLGTMESNFSKKISEVNISKKLGLFFDYWSLKIVAELNGQHVKLVKFKGDFEWHKHFNEDEIFYVLQGEFKMEMRDETILLKENAFLIVQKGMEHRLVADHEVSIMLFDQATTLNTGDAQNELSKHAL